MVAVDYQQVGGATGLNPAEVGAPDQVGVHRRGRLQGARHALHLDLQAQPAELLALQNTHQSRRAHYTHTEVKEWVAEHPDPFDVALVLPTGPARLPITPTVATYCALRLMQIDADDTAEFLARLLQY